MCSHAGNYIMGSALMWRSVIDQASELNRACPSTSLVVPMYELASSASGGGTIKGIRTLDPPRE